MPIAFRKHALLSPYAVMKKPLTLEDHQSSRMVVEPLHLFDCSLITDGAAVVLLTTAERAGDMKQRPVYIAGMQGLRSGRSEFIFAPPGLGINQQWSGRVTPRERDLVIYQRANIGREAVQGFYTYDAFSPLVLFALERFGFCGAGEAASWVQDGRIELGPQVTIQRPTTMYGITKVAGELLCDYYASRFSVDARGLRLPGLISYVAPPGGGTTDYAVEIFYQALRYRHYTCFLAADTRLDLMYMPDAIRAMNQLMEADAARLRYRNAYNVTAMSITPAELAAEIRKHVHGFAIDFQVDPVRQCIADSWPRSLDASAAWEDWGFAPQFDLASMTTDMLARLSAKIKAQKAGG